MVKSLPSQPMQLPKLCMYSVFLIEMNMSSWTNSLTSSALTMPNTLTLDQQKITVNGTTHQCKSMKGWFICCRWKNSSTSWENLSDLKASHPVQSAEFAIQRNRKKLSKSETILRNLQHEDINLKYLFYSVS